MADIATESVRPPEAADSKATWICVAAGVHLVLWGVVFWYLWEHIPVQKLIFEDFGVPVSPASRAVISLSDLVVIYWYLVVPMVLVIVVGIDYLIVSLLRSPVMRATLIALLVIPPIGLVARWKLVLLRDLSGLMEQLR